MMPSKRNRLEDRNLAGERFGTKTESAWRDEYMGIAIKLMPA